MNKIEMNSEEDLLIDTNVEVPAKYQNFIFRGLATAKWFIGAHVLMIIFFFARYGYDPVAFFWFGGMALLLTGYALYKNVDLLYKCSFDQSSQQVEVLVFHYNDVRRYTCRREDFKLKVERDFSSRYKSYQIMVYISGKLIITQRQIGPWTNSKITAVAKSLGVKV